MASSPDASHGYAELYCQSHYSFLQATSSPAQLVARAAALGYCALAITDECSLSGVVAAHQAAVAYPQLKLIIGGVFRLQDVSGQLLLLARRRRGYGQLCRLITTARRQAEKGEYILHCEDLSPSGQDDCLAIWVPDSDATPAEGLRLQAHFPQRFWLGLTHHLCGGEATWWQPWRQWAEDHHIPSVACGGVLMHQRSERPTLDVLNAIRLKRPVSALGHDSQRNGERHLRPMAHLQTLFDAASLQETLAIAAQCQFSLDELRYEYPEEVVPRGQTAEGYLRRETEQGAETRWPQGVPEAVRQQIANELALIREMRYEAYFLTVYDLVRFARSRGILCQGRGSAANSVVCYCLGITAVNPERVGLLFERFISKERNEPPDIDVDFEHERREEVVQYLYQKYGRERTALAAAITTYRTRSALRDVGKALDFSPDQLDAMINALGRWEPLSKAKAHLTQAGFCLDNPVVKQCLYFVERLKGTPRHLSQHVGGFVIARGRLDELVPIENAAMAERTVIQWEKDDLEALGLMKVDVLALGMLSAIRKCFALVQSHHQKKYSLATLPEGDGPTYDMLQRADTVGVFQIESRAQMAMLPRLKPRCYYDLVVQVAIVRPGPIQGDMVHPYLQRRAHPELVQYPNDELKSVLSGTLGVPIFQEQVMKIAMVAASFSAGEADQLRRSMAAWKRRGGLEPFEEKLTQGMLENGYSRAFAQRIFQQIKGFGDYGFPESHAASFALLAYVSAYLKCHYPAAFCCALLNSQPMGFYRPAQLVADARRHGVAVWPVDVQQSHWDHRLQNTEAQGSPALRLGLRQVKGLQEAAGRRIEAAQAQVAFDSVQDLAHRAGLDAAALDALAAADALVSLSGHRHRAQWASLGVEPMSPLLRDTFAAEGEPLLPKPSEWQDIAGDYAQLGLTLKRHPLALLRAQLDRQRVVPAERLADLHHGQVVRVAGVVIGRQRPGTATGVIFVTLEDETGCANVIVWPKHAEAQRKVLLGAKIMQVTGVVQIESGVVHVLAGRLRDRGGDLLTELNVSSRDFQ